MSIFLDNMDVQQIALAMDEVSLSILSAYSQLNEDRQLSFTLHPQRITTGLSQFLDVMYMIEMHRVNNDIADDLGYDNESAMPQKYALDYSELTEIGNYGLELMQTLSEWAGRLQLSEEQQQLQSAMIVVSLWIARHGGSLTTLESVTDTLTEAVKAPIEPILLNALCDVMGELVNAVANEVKSLEAPSHLRAVWSELNSNWGLVAVRTMDVDIMQHVFDSLVRNIPDDISEFFERLLMQTESDRLALVVQNVIKSYYQRYTISVLH